MNTFQNVPSQIQVHYPQTNDRVTVKIVNFIPSRRTGRSPILLDDNNNGYRYCGNGLYREIARDAFAHRLNECQPA